jgi:hypothetical protein
MTSFFIPSSQGRKLPKTKGVTIQDDKLLFNFFRKEFLENEILCTLVDHI